ncbi:MULTISPECIES: carbohydrate ABC transporter permease [Sphaerochaeta]|jgi:sn-glycerol 3-phosphate transport system permease protein|uniref:sn-glycerol-3-phosphate transport system permease protein UgpE n=2 Tax=root TaxID=1 RepID=A0ABY4D899_9SPIR|nr:MULTISPECIES: carbohydrate ABC transporter permease [Sphaerochaeta]MDD3456614.1 carbohydrate ABC transporter permease [Sphaerochaeta sp.]MEA5029622.1 carbohydrate ABC transporter permease [Sphaerochaeta associata]MEA5108273.1 carbohydrate ABC transporter permease [Sphaerochaeta associata]UOM50523.1 carbohydrate ABC transporter permease [Sphaerochaeta associata]SMP40728.1 carbohydrate ABC transporter membrane protein 2, CUT1 family [Sphaerochaeta associata]
MRIASSLRRRLNNTGRFFLNIPLMLIILVPLLYTISISVMPPDEIYGNHLIPTSVKFTNYIQAFTNPYYNFPRMILNSFIVSTTVMLGQMVTCSLAAFAFSFLQFKGKKILFLGVLATMMVPGEVTIIANYLTMAGWGWLDSYRALVFPFLTSAMGIFLLRQYYLTFAKELYEAAKLDGCSNLRFLTSIVVPLSRPALGALGAYVFLNTWNQYMWPLLVTNSREYRTVQIGISMLYDIDAVSLGLMMAGVVIVIVPSLSIFVFMNKQLINGLMAGAVKG